MKDNKKLKAQDFIDFSQADLIDINKWEKEKVKREKEEERKRKISRRLQQPVFSRKPKTRTGKRMKVSVPSGIRGLLSTIR